MVQKMNGKSDANKNIRIEMQNVFFRTATHEMVNALSFRAMRGQSVAFVGAPGSGKSTVLKLAAGILLPNSGKVLFDGVPIHHMTRGENLRFRGRCGFQFQNAALWANQSIMQNMELPAKIHFPDESEKERTERIHNCLSLVGYTKSTGIRPAELSTGEQKLVAFARAFLCSPEILFLDEWEESLDHKSVQRLLKIIQEWKTETKTLLFVSHNAVILRELADDICVIKNGGIAETIKPDALAQTDVGNDGNGQDVAYEIQN